MYKNFSDDSLKHQKSSQKNTNIWLFEHSSDFFPFHFSPLFSFFSSEPRVNKYKKKKTELVWLKR